MRRLFNLKIFLAATLVVAGTAWLLWERCGLSGCPDVGRLAGYLPDRASVVLDRNGVVLARLYAVRYPIVPLDSLPPYVPAAFVAIEDQRFWEHAGVDWQRAMGAALANLRSLRIRQGFSTITMQLARNAFPDRLPYSKRTISRKFAEMRVARAIEERFTKEQILELYLNHIYFGGGARGIDAASREYFGKSATKLTLAEAALLAGMITAPNGLNPRLNPRLAYERRWVVLHVMWRHGSISIDEANEADDAPLITTEGTTEAGALAPYFVEEVRHHLERELGAALYGEGYTIHTTLDARLQAVATEELRAALEVIEGEGAGGRGREGGEGVGAGQGEGAGEGEEASGGGEAGEGQRSRGEDAEAGPLQGAVVVLDVQTGDVLAMVGGRDFRESRFNRAVRAIRPAGGTLKPFVYAAALANGFAPTDVLDDSPMPRRVSGGSVWAPRNVNDAYAGSVTLREALVRSSNVAAIRLAEEVGLEAVASTAERLGLRGPLPRVPALALGAAEVSLLDLASAYAAFAGLGLRAEPRMINRVVSEDGVVVWQGDPEVREVLFPGVAFLVTDILREAVDRGMGIGVREAGFQGPAAGATGTSANALDYWFVGYTPRRVAGIWVGHDMPRPIVYRTPSDRFLPSLWGRIIGRTSSGLGESWTPPLTVEPRRVGADGSIISPGCQAARAVRTEYFLSTNAPSGSCDSALATPVNADDAADADTLAVPASTQPAVPR